MAFYPPELELFRECYSIERVQDGIAFADVHLNPANKPPPMVVKLLATYKSACQDFLIRSGYQTGFQELSRTALLTDIQAFEESISNLYWFTNDYDEEMEDLQPSLLKLRRCQYYARYSDFARQLAHKLGITMFGEEAEDWDVVAREYPWKKLSEKLKEEHPAYKKHGLRAGKDEIQTTWFVRAVCMAIGADFAQMEEAIHTCGDREQALTSNVDTLLAKGEYKKLATMISADLNDLSSIFPLELKHDETVIRAILIQLKERWFKIEWAEPPFYPTSSLWEPTAHLQKEHLNHDDPATEKTAKAHTHKMVARHARRRLHALKMVKKYAVTVEKPPRPQTQPTNIAAPPPTPPYSPSSSSPPPFLPPISLPKSHQRKFKRQTETQRRHATFYLRKRKSAYFAVASASARNHDAYASSLHMQRVLNTVDAMLQLREDNGAAAGVMGEGYRAVEQVEPMTTPATSIWKGNEDD